MNKFNKVSLEQYLEDFGSDPEKAIGLYEIIKKPKRATTYSAGYDFFAPFDFELKKGQTIKIPTGINVSLDNNKVLFIVPRSGLGFKYRTQLDNTIGVIDADYVHSKNEGHIFIKITNDSKKDDVVKIKQGEAFAQGIILQYSITVDDELDKKDIRNGGFGSTTH